MGAIVWLASYPKSGNTWTRNFLHNLLRPKVSPQDINDMEGLTAYDVGAQWYEGLLEKPLEECSNQEVARVRPKAQERLAAQAEGLVFVKTHAAFVNDYGYASINKNVTAGAVYIVRNPLDVAISYAHHNSSTVDETIGLLNNDSHHTRNNARQAYEPMGSWREHVLSWTRTPHQALHVVRYEDLHARPDESFGALCRFLRIEPSRMELRAAIRKSSFDRLKEQEQQRGFREKPERAERFFREGRVGEWRERLTPAQVAAVIERNREQMARFGYLPENA